MTAAAPIRKSAEIHGYVHKFRSDALEGGLVEIDATLPPQRSQGGWILAKFIGLSFAFTSLLVFAAHELIH